MKPTLVTGATGFVGWHVARKLLERGERVRALVRDPGRLRELEGVEGFQGDLRDPASLSRAVEGCGVVYHIAADYRLWTRDPEEMFRSNVEGTGICWRPRSVMESRESFIPARWAASGFRRRESETSRHPLASKKCRALQAVQVSG